MDTEYTEPNYTFEVTTMIIDKTSNLELYKSLIPHLDGRRERWKAQNLNLIKIFLTFSGFWKARR